MSEFLTQINPAENPLGDMDLSKILFVKFTKPGDYVKGTLIERSESVDKFAKVKGDKQKLYLIKAAVGKYHDDNKVVEIKAGDHFYVGGKPSIDKGMTLVRIGQLVGIIFVGTKASKEKGYQPAKIFEVRKSGMDPEFLSPEEREED
jgi:hypothetical protein